MEPHRPRADGQTFRRRNPSGRARRRTLPVQQPAAGFFMGHLARFGLRPFCNQRNRARPAIPRSAQTGRQYAAAGVRYVQRNPFPPHQRLRLRHDLRRRAEKHRPLRRHHRHHPRRFARALLRPRARRMELQIPRPAPGHVQHPVHLPHLHFRPGVPLAAVARRRCPDGNHQHPQSQNPVRRHRLQRRLLHQQRRSRRPLENERNLHHRQ